MSIINELFDSVVHLPAASTATKLGEDLEENPAQDGGSLVHVQSSRHIPLLSRKCQTPVESNPQSMIPALPL